MNTYIKEIKTVIVYTISILSDIGQFSVLGVKPLQIFHQFVNLGTEWFVAFIFLFKFN